jgi:hypothetical protein
MGNGEVEFKRWESISINPVKFLIGGENYKRRRL